ncbi:hypothetical protein PTTG_11670 [Puccinia triticina 1-1 BBBD Race 1]|uniref:Uncharacterized protein n=1 Tax=Puccinia triticina (isolate 1-1 / race 1 (BBBD)) TaxID=630390 RepID=A0A180GYV2_PUCT1|nr:hypothetical protein PTTG_11670 [Puccinia triticina 1-1 BBBD Race 1]WAR59122.1 hypothetical protein PtB15_10B464 [Puccinia triticina]
MTLFVPTMILLPFVLLSTCAAHSPASLAHHNLHKRMAGDMMENIFSPPSVTRTFSYADNFKKQTFRHLPPPDKLSERQMKTVIPEFFNKNCFKNCLKDDRAGAEQPITEPTTRNLISIQQLIFVEMNPLRPDHVILQNNKRIDKALGSARTTGNGNPLAELADKLASFNQRDLQASRSAIRSHEDQLVASLADVYGFLGPENIFAPHLLLILGRKRIADTLPKKIEPKTFLKGLQFVQTGLAELANEEPLYNIHFVKQFAKEQVEMFGDSGTFNAFMSEIARSEPYQAFQMELQSPQDTAGYQLQLIQLPRAAQKWQNALQLPGDNASRINLQDWALENTKRRLVLASRAWELTENMLDIYTPDGLQLLLNKIRV